MGNLSSTITIAAIDNVSKPARTISQALKDMESNAKAVAKGMAGTGATDRFVNSLSKLKTTRADIEQVANAWRDYAKAEGLAANASQWTKAQSSQVRAWEANQIRAIRAVRREEQQYFTSQQRASAVRGRPGEFVGGVAGGIASAIAAHKVFEAGKQAVEAGAERQHVRVGAMNAGIGPEELQRVEASAIQAKKNAPNLSVSEIMELHKEARSAVQHPDEVFDLIPDLAKAASILKGMGAENANIADIVKGGESLGLMNDPARFHKYLEGQVKAMAVMGKTITTEQIYEAAKYSKSAGSTLSDEFLNTTMPSLIQEMHGQSAGDALAMLTKNFRGGLAHKHLAVTKMNELGLLAEPDKIVKAKKSGQIMGYTGKVKGDDLLVSNPRKWFQDVFNPAAEAAGYKTLADKIGLLNMVLPQTAANLGRIFLQQEETLKQHARNYEAAPGLDKSVENQRGDAKLGVGALSKAVDDLEASLTGPMMPAIAAGLSGLANGIQGLAAAVQEAPNIGATVAELTGLAGAALALKAAPFAASMVGLEGVATSLGLFSAALIPVVAILAAGALALNATNAMEDARKSGKDPDKTYLSDALLGLSNFLQGKGWKRDEKYEDKFDSKGYEWNSFKAWRDREEAKPKTWRPGASDAPTPPRRPTDFGFEGGQGSAAPKVDGSQVDALKQKAVEAKASVDTLNTTVTPNVDKASIDAANGAVSQLLANLAKVGTMAANIQSTVNNIKIPSLGSIQRGHFSAGGVQGE